MEIAQVSNMFFIFLCLILVIILSRIGIAFIRLKKKLNKLKKRLELK